MTQSIARMLPLTCFASGFAAGAALLFGVPALGASGSAVTTSAVQQTLDGTARHADDVKASAGHVAS